MDSPMSTTYPRASSASAFFLSVFERIPKHPSGASRLQELHARACELPLRLRSGDLIRSMPTITDNRDNWSETAKESHTGCGLERMKRDVHSERRARREAIRARKIITRRCNGQSANCWTPTFLQRYLASLTSRVCDCVGVWYKFASTLRSHVTVCGNCPTR